VVLERTGGERKAAMDVPRQDRRAERSQNHRLSDNMVFWHDDGILRPLPAVFLFVEKGDVKAVAYTAVGLPVFGGLSFLGLYLTRLARAIQGNLPYVAPVRKQILPPSRNKED
jgi:hypothetical protein